VSRRPIAHSEVPASARRDGACSGSPRQADDRRGSTDQLVAASLDTLTPACSSPISRKIALRQSAVARSLSARLAGDGRGADGCGPASRHSIGNSARVGPRAALLGPGRRLEGEEGRSTLGRGEEEMREGLADSGIAPPDAIERVLCHWGVSAAGKLRGQEHSFTSRGRECPAAPRAGSRTTGGPSRRRDLRVRPGLDDKRSVPERA